MQKKILRGTLGVVCLLAAIAYICGSSPVSAADEPPVAPAIETAPTTQHKGTVLSTFDEDGYTYIKYEENKNVSWVAVLQVPVKEGNVIEFPDSQALLNYQSKTLHEPFAKIIFAHEYNVSEAVKEPTVPTEEAKNNKTESPAAIIEAKTDKKPPAAKEETKESASHTGKVISSISTNGYTYIEYEENETVSWVAVPKTEVKQGDMIEFPDSPIMENFGSKSLKRTFEKIYFAGELKIIP